VFLYCIIDPINAALVIIKDFLKHLQKKIFNLKIVLTPKQ